MDELLTWRAEFPIVDTCTYLVSHSLGAMPRRAADYLAQFADEWDRRGVRAWHEGWWEIGVETGNLLAPIAGRCGPTRSRCTRTRRSRSRSSRRSSPSVARATGSCCRIWTFRPTTTCSKACAASAPKSRSCRRTTRCARRSTGSWMRSTIGRRSCPLSLVLFRSGALQDVRPVVEQAHRVGARVVLDVYQAAGTVPLDLAALGVDFAVGGSVKWLCGGPGAGYLYVRPDLVSTVEPAVVGWAGHRAPFAFETGADPSTPRASSAFRAARQTCRPCTRRALATRSSRRLACPPIREKSLRLTRRLMDAADPARLAPEYPDGRRGARRFGGDRRAGRRGA